MTHLQRINSEKLDNTWRNVSWDVNMVPMPWMLIPLKSSNVVFIIRYVSAGFRVQSAEPKHMVEAWIILRAPLLTWIIIITYICSRRLFLSYDEQDVQGRRLLTTLTSYQHVPECEIFCCKLGFQCNAQRPHKKRWNVMHTSVHFKCHQYLSNSERNGRNYWVYKRESCRMNQQARKRRWHQIRFVYICKNG